MDLLDSKAMFIAHGCNSRGAMNSGVAKAIREKYPEAFTAYRRYFETHGLELGSVIIAPVSDGKTVLNLITQESFGYDGARYVSYDAIDDAFRKVAIMAKSEKVAIPMIGAGLGGGVWEAIRAIIDKASGDTPIEVYHL